MSRLEKLRERLNTKKGASAGEGGVKKDKVSLEISKVKTTSKLLLIVIVQTIGSDYLTTQEH